LYEAREYPREGDERLSARKSGKTGGAGNDGSGRPPKHPKTGRRGDIGRALRTIYDDTLREPVPDDFLDIIGKLS
jgi:hypothetical protein